MTEKPAAYLIRGGSTDNASLLCDPPLSIVGIKEAREAAEFLAIQGIGNVFYLPETAEKEFAAVIVNAVPMQRSGEEMYAPTVFVTYPSRKETILSNMVLPGGIVAWDGEGIMIPVFKPIC